MGLSNLDQCLALRLGWLGTDHPPTREFLRSWQLDQLRRIVEHASKNSPFYARHFETVFPEKIASLDDFSSLPTMTADDLRRDPEQLLCLSRDAVARVVTLHSSGTTGPPKRVFHTHADLEATVDYFRWGMANLVGIDEGVLVLMPGDRPDGVGRLLVDALTRAGARPVPYGIFDRTGDVIARCLREQVRCIVGPSAHLNMVARAWERECLPKDQIRSVLLCWDMAPGIVVQNVEKAFGCKVFRHWGMIETGLGGAVECCPGSGLHVREADVYVEIVCPETGELLPDGEFGEIVVSTPLRRGMPLIRYRTGDSGRIVSGQCACGSPARRLDPRVFRRDEGVDIGTGVIGLQELNEVLYAVDGLDDFCVAVLPGEIRVTVSSWGEGVSRRVRAALETVEPLQRGVTQGMFKIEIQIENGGVPAVQGLGKRRIELHLGS